MVFLLGYIHAYVLVNAIIDVIMFLHSVSDYWVLAYENVISFLFYIGHLLCIYRIHFQILKVFGKIIGVSQLDNFFSFFMPNCSA